MKNVVRVLCAQILLATSIVPSAGAAPETFAEPPPEAVKSPSGLASIVLVPGSGKTRPKADDVVAVHYIARRLDGEVFMDTHGAEKPAIFELAKVFPGWREGIRKMVVGETRRLWIPPGLGSPQESETVIFDVELMGIRGVGAPPPDLLSPPADAETRGSGVRFKVLQQGTGEQRLSVGDAPMMRYTGWTTDGRVFDGSAQRGRPTLFPLDKVLPAFSDCVLGMAIGESRRCWIPQGLAQGRWVGNPEGDLVFDLELISLIDADKLFSDETGGGG